MLLPYLSSFQRYLVSRPANQADLILTRKKSPVLTPARERSKSTVDRRRVTWAPRVTQVLLLALLAMALILGSSSPSFANGPTTLSYFDGHMHTTKSDGSGTVAGIKASAPSRGLDAVIITDHCEYLTRTTWADLVAETAAASTASFLAVPGFEVTDKDGLLRDHVVAYGVDDPFVGHDAAELCPEEVWESPYNPAGTGPLYPEHLTKWVDDIHSQQGIAVHVHTLGSTQLDYGVNNVEIYNPRYRGRVRRLCRVSGLSASTGLGIGDGTEQHGHLWGEGSQHALGLSTLA